MIRIDLRLAALMTLPPALWAGNAVVGRWVVEHCPPLAFNAMRWAVAALLLWPLGAQVLRDRRTIAAVRTHLFVLGLLGAALFGAVQYAALHTTSAINLTLIAATMPLWMLAVGWGLAGQRPAPRQAVGALLSLAGVVVVLSRGRPQDLADLRPVTGDLLMLAGVAAFALYSWLLARPPQVLRASQAPPWDWAGLLLLQTLFALPVAGTGAVVEWAVDGVPVRWSAALAAAVLFVAVGPSIVAYRCWAIGVARGGPALAALFGNLSPLFAALFAALALGEWPQAHHGIAGTLILAGVVVAAGAGATGSPRPV